MDRESGHRDWCQPGPRPGSRQPLVRLGASKIILAVRDLSLGAKAKHDIETSTARGGIIDVWHLELSCSALVKAFAKRASDSLVRLDARVENTAIATPSFRLAAGREPTVSVNVVGTFYLALLLSSNYGPRRARTHAGACPHISVVGSDVIFYTSFPERQAARIFEHLNDRAAAREMLWLAFFLRIFAVGAHRAERAVADNLPAFSRTLQ